MRQLDLVIPFFVDIDAILRQQRRHLAKTHHRGRHQRNVKSIWLILYVVVNSGFQPTFSPK